MELDKNSICQAKGLSSFVLYGRSIESSFYSWSLTGVDDSAVVISSSRGGATSKSCISLWYCFDRVVPSPCSFVERDLFGTWLSSLRSFWGVSLRVCMWSVAGSHFTSWWSFLEWVEVWSISFSFSSWCFSWFSNVLGFSYSLWFSRWSSRI